MHKKEIKKEICIGTRLDLKLYDQLKILADKDQRTIANLLRLIIENHIKDQIKE